jgi:predicted kinase
MVGNGRMFDTSATLHLFCGKIASGKSSLARELGRSQSCIRVSEDHLLANLYPAQIITLDDYAKAAARLRQAIGPHILELLRVGVDVALDFQANTLIARAWLRQIIDQTQAHHVLHYLRASDEICKARLQARNAMGCHEYHVDDESFELFTAHFVPPSPTEGFNLVLHDQQ